MLRTPPKGLSSGIENFIKLHEEEINNMPQIRCWKVDAFFKAKRLGNRPQVLAMNEEDNHHYMPIKTFRHIYKVFLNRKHKNQ